MCTNEDLQQTTNFSPPAKELKCLYSAPSSRRLEDLSSRLAERWYIGLGDKEVHVSCVSFHPISFQRPLGWVEHSGKQDSPWQTYFSKWVMKPPSVHREELKQCHPIEISLQKRSHFKMTWTSRSQLNQGTSPSSCVEKRENNYAFHDSVARIALQKCRHKGHFLNLPVVQTKL